MDGVASVTDGRRSLVERWILRSVKEMHSCNLQKITVVPVRQQQNVVMNSTQAEIMTNLDEAETQNGNPLTAGLAGQCQRDKGKRMERERERERERVQEKQGARE